MDFFGIFGGNFLDFSWIFFGGIFWEEFLGGFFCEDLFGRNLFGRIFWEDFLRRIFWGEDLFGRNSLFILLKSANLFESERDWCFCQDFVSIKKEKGKKFRSLEVRGKLIALKKLLPLPFLSYMRQHLDQRLPTISFVHYRLLSFLKYYPQVLHRLKITKRNGILLPKFFSEFFLKFEAEGRESSKKNWDHLNNLFEQCTFKNFANSRLSASNFKSCSWSLEQSFLTVKGQIFFWNRMLFFTYSWRFLWSNTLDRLEFKLEDK